MIPMVIGKGELKAKLAQLRNEPIPRSLRHGKRVVRRFGFEIGARLPGLRLRPGAVSGRHRRLTTGGGHRGCQRDFSTFLLHTVTRFACPIYGTLTTTSPTLADS